MQKITNIATYPLPGIPAFRNGKSVRLIACGDQDGSSPVEKFVDETGHLFWGKQEEFTVLDAPASTQNLTKVLRSLSGQA